jgi:RND superfamily putative drug exporter
MSMVKGDTMQFPQGFMSVIHPKHDETHTVIKSEKLFRTARTSSPHPGKKPSPSFNRIYGSFLYHARWYILLFWLVVFLGCLPFARLLPGILQNSGYIVSGSESNRVNQLLVSRLHQPTTWTIIVFQSSTALVSDPAYQQEIQAVVKRVKSFPHVLSIQSDGVGLDHRTTVLRVGSDEDRDAAAQRMPAMRRLLSAVPATPAHILLTGETAITDELPLEVQKASQFAEMAGLPLTFLVLLIVFGTVGAALMPVLLALVTVSVSSALVYLLALHSNMNIFVLNVVSITALGLSIDYSLFIIRRFREELARGSTVQEALQITVATAGSAILHSGLAVLIGFFGLLWIGIGLMTSYGLGGIMSTAITLCVALTLLPAILGVLGERINALRLPVLTGGSMHFRSGSARTETKTFWQIWAQFIMKRPVLAIVLSIAILLCAGWPARTLVPRLPDAFTLPPTSPSHQGYAVIKAQFPALNHDPIVVIVQTPDGSSIMDAAHMQSLQRITHWVATQPHVTQVVSLAQPPRLAQMPPLDAQQLAGLYASGSYQRLPQLAQFVASISAGDTSMMLVQTDAAEGSQAELTLITHLRSMRPQIKEGLQTLVGGTQATNLDFNQVLYTNFLLALIFILLATYILLLFTFHSLLLPLKAILMNIISVSAAYGTLVYIFQEGHFANVLGFTSSGFIICFVPILMFCILFGLSMDYEVFLLSRIREEWLRTRNNSAAVALGLEKTGGVITNAALLLVIVAGSFIWTSLIVTKELGFGITVSVLVDATLIRCLLVPATMQLLGRWNWWLPGRRNKIEPVKPDSAA